MGGQPQAHTRGRLLTQHHNLLGYRFVCVRTRCSPQSKVPTMNLPSISNDLPAIFRDGTRVLQPRSRVRPLVRPIAQRPTGRAPFEPYHSRPSSSVEVSENVMASNQRHCLGATSNTRTFLPVRLAMLGENDAIRPFTPLRMRPGSKATTSFPSLREHEQVAHQGIRLAPSQSTKTCDLALYRPNKMQRRCESSSPKVARLNTPVCFSTDDTPTTPMSCWSHAEISLSPPSLIRNKSSDEGMIEMESENLPLEIMLPSF